MKCPYCNRDLEYFPYAENSCYCPYYCWDCDEDFTIEELNKSNQLIDEILEGKES